MPWGLKRYYGSGSLHFVTWSCYRRKPLRGNPASRDLVLTVLELMRVRYRFAVVGYVVMPELELLGGENSAERWLRVGRVSSRNPTSRKEREKWGTRLCYQIVVRTTENRRLSIFLFQLPNPLLQELPLWFLLGQRQRLFIRSTSLSCPAEPAVHICTG
jgi:putative transposase